MTLDGARSFTDIHIECLELEEIERQQGELHQFVRRARDATLNHDPRWLGVLTRGLRQIPFLLRARCGAETLGILPLSLLKSVLFGRHFVSLPYLNGGGVLALKPDVSGLLLDRAIQLAGEHKVRFLELRHESPVSHTGLSESRTDKVHMRLGLPTTSEELWKQLSPKVRNQVRKGELQDFEVVWGREELLNDFYRVFSHNMRDLGTPVFGKPLFREMLRSFVEEAEVCVLRLGNDAVAAAILLHFPITTDVPSASTLRQYNKTNANMFMYWQLLCRAIERGQKRFDFGRSSVGSGTYKFKQQWGAKPEPAVWQYHVLHGEIDHLRRDNDRFGLMIKVWQRLPVSLTRLIGPRIVRGIP